MTECYLLFFLDYWDKTVSVVKLKSKLSTLTLNNVKVSKETGTGTVV